MWVMPAEVTEIARVLNNICKGQGLNALLSSL